MVGTIINVAAILAGGIASVSMAKRLAPETEHRIRLVLGILTIYIGLTAVWESINGSFFDALKQVGIMMAALVIGNLIGKLLRLQHRINKLGEFAKTRFQEGPAETNRLGEGFVTCTILFCVGPLAILGALEEGLTGSIKKLAVKSVMDGLATFAFAKTFGWGVILAAIPVLAYQGTITLAANSLQPVLAAEGLIDSINATGGLLILCISVVILNIQKVPLADYLPSLLVAPLLTWFLL